MFYKRIRDDSGREGFSVYGLGKYSLKDTLECGQCFRYEPTVSGEDYIEYMTVVGDKVILVGQRTPGELIFPEISEEELISVAVPYFSLDTDYAEIKKDVLKNTDSEWLRRAAEAGEGIAILRQDAWEALFSFIISQNNNIPRIRKIIKKLSSEYGENLSLKNGIKKCPLSLTDAPPCDEICAGCGACYSFPTAEEIISEPEKMLSANPGFRYKYLLDAAEKVARGEVNLNMIAAARSYEHTKGELMRIKGVGEKVAACTALFGFGNYEAFPIDVWMRRAIDEYFGGKLDPKTLGRYAGIAQQYIFHYIRNKEEK